MEIETQYDQKSPNHGMLIQFPTGLLGFEEFKDYRLLSSETEKDLHWLQPVENEAIEFAVTLPQIYQINYEISLNDDEEQSLDFEENDEIIVLVTLSKKENPKPGEPLLNANFMAPIIINASKQLGLQKTLNQEQSPVTITMKG